jgi:hypothetical protein
VRRCDPQRHATTKRTKIPHDLAMNQPASPRRAAHFCQTPVSAVHLKMSADSRPKYLILLILSGYFTFFKKN